MNNSSSKLCCTLTIPEHMLHKKLLGNYMIIVHSLLNPTSTSQKQAFMHVRLEFVWKWSLHVNCTTKQPMSLCCVRIAGQGQRWRWR